MEWRQPRPGRNRNVFKGSFLVSTLLDQHSSRFKGRAVAVKFAKKLFREGQIKSIFGANTFEDSAHLYMWNDDVINRLQMANMTSDHLIDGRKESRCDKKVVENAKNRILNKGEQINWVKPFKDTNRDYCKSNDILSRPYKSPESKRYFSYSTDSSLESQKITRQANKIYSQHKYSGIMSKPRNHTTIPEEKLDMAEVASMEYISGSGNVTGTMNSQASSAVTGDSENNRRWGETVYSYSDNEKQLIEEMKRMKKEHQHILKTYEERINKLMAKMHELRGIAEMLENSSTKSSPYGILPNKANILSIIGSKLEEERKQAGLLNNDEDAPPPLPPRPTRGNKVYPNKPIIHTGVIMKNVPWTRLIIGDEGDNGLASIWHNMMEPKIDVEELERLFCASKETLDDISLFDDIYVGRGRPKHQLVNIYDNEKSQRIISEMRNLHCSLSDLVQCVTILDIKDLNQECLAQLLDLICSSRDIDKIMHHVKRKGSVQLDYPEYLLAELSKVDHFRERLEFLRFREKLQINLFEIEQQLRELHTACDEIGNSLALKNLLGTLLTVGNYLNGGSEKGQADGYNLDILNKLKDVTDKSRRGNLLEFVVKSYCKIYESDVESGCPTRFRLPEPSNMRHAAQVSFEDIQRALSSLRQELQTVRERIESLAKKENNNITYQLRVTSENYLTSAIEVLSEEDKLLEDTKKYFYKTATYFIHDSGKCSPQDFFQILATFLHDTKFYWKLSHRNLAKARFELDFSNKNQMSSCSHNSKGGYRSEVKKHLSALGEEHERHIARAQQLKHINNWIESVGKYTEEIKSEVPPYSSRSTSKKDNQTNSKHRPSSPKPLTSTPPNVHKPKALNHNSPTQTVPPYYGNGNHNYMNQESPYDTLTRGQQLESEDNSNRNTQSTLRSPPDSSQKKANTQFSLKSWLKREQTKRNDDNGNNLTPKSQSTPGSTGTLGKIRNTVVNKFSNSKRPVDTPNTRTKPENVHHQHNAKNITSPHGNQTILTGNEINVNMVTGPNIYLERSKGDYQGLYFEVPISRDNGTNGQVSNPSTLNSSKSRDSSPPKYDLNKDPQYSAQRINMDAKNISPHNDLNNNRRARGIPPETPPKPLRSRDRAQIPVGISNLGSSDYYPKHDENHHSKQIPHIINTDPKIVMAEAVTVYTAKSTPNYENQIKIDHRSQVIRGHAEPLNSSHKQQASNSSDAYRNELAKKSEMFLKSGNSSHKSSLSPESYRSGPAASKSNSDFSRSPQQHFGEYPTRRSASTQNILEKHSNHLSPQTLSEKQSISSSRPPVNSSSINNLIGRFEKSPNQLETDKEPSMTSTPITHRRNNQLSPDQDSYKSTPHRSRSEDRHKPRSRESSQQRLRESSQHRQHDIHQRHDDYNHSDKAQTYPVPKPRRMQPQTNGQGNQQQYQYNSQTSQHHHSHHNQHHQQSESHQHHPADQYRQSKNHNYQQQVYSHHQPSVLPNHQSTLQYQVYKATPVSYSKPSPENNYGFSDHEDNYSDQLRKASKVTNSAVFDPRYQNTTSPPYGRHQHGTMAVVKPTVVQPKAMEI